MILTFDVLSKTQTSGELPYLFAPFAKKIFSRLGYHWIKALERDGFTCQICGKQDFNKGGICVHHKDGSGESTAKNHELDNLITLCKKCHWLFHRITLIRVNGDYLVKGKIFEKLGIESIKTCF